jgi:hemoglobin
VRPSLYEFAGGDEAFLALARAHHARCLADPELNHPFSHAGLHPAHVERLAAYWAEVMGGPSRFSQLSDQSSMLRLHAGHGPGMLELSHRFVECFVAAADDAGLPDDARFRAVLRAYMEWATGVVDAYAEPGSTVPDGLRVPRWDWERLAPADRSPARA